MECSHRRGEGFRARRCVDRGHRGRYLGHGAKARLCCAVRIFERVARLVRRSTMSLLRPRWEARNRQDDADAQDATARPRVPPASHILVVDAQVGRENRRGGCHHAVCAPYYKSSSRTQIARARLEIPGRTGGAWKLAKPLYNHARDGTIS